MLDRESKQMYQTASQKVGLFFEEKQEYEDEMEVRRSGRWVGVNRC